MQMRSYEAARSYFGFLSLLSWCVIVFGVVISFVALSAVGQMSRGFGGTSVAGLAGLIPGFAIIFLGFLGLVFVQIGRAGVDSAEYAQQNLKIAREQLEISKQVLKQGAALEQGYAALQAAKADLQVEPSIAPSASYSDTQKAKPASSQVSGDIGGRQNGHAVVAVVGSAQAADSSISYNGQMIEKQGNQYLVEGKGFISLDDAKRYVNENPRRKV